LTEQSQEKRDGFRKACEPRPVDLCRLGADVLFYQMKVVDESPLGLGCICEGEHGPEVGEQLDWCGLKRYKVCWVNKKESGQTRVGLRSA
jgi:hypothetical protein